jgi:hypothetical protein
MIFVGAGFHRDIEIAAAGLSKFGSIIAGLNRVLLNGRHTLLVHSRALRQHSVGGFHPFDADTHGSRRGAVDTEPGPVLVKRAWKQRHHRIGISNDGGKSRQRNGIRALGTDIVAEFTAFCLQQGGIGAHRNGFLNVAHLQRDINTQRLCNHDRDSGSHILLEPGLRRRELVHANRQLG